MRPSQTRNDMGLFSKGAWFREWRINRTFVLVAAALLVIGPVISLLRCLGTVDPVTPMKVALFWRFLVPAIYSFNYNPPQGLPSISMFHAASGTAVKESLTVVVTVLGCVMWANDRNSALAATLLGPLSRRSIAVTKVWLGSIAIASSWLVVGMVIASVNAWSGDTVAWSTFGGWWISNLLTFLAGFAVGYAIGSAVGFWAPAACLSTLSLFFPWFVGSVLAQCIGGGAAESYMAAQYPSNVIGMIKGLSPLSAAGMTETGTSNAVTVDLGTSLDPLGWFHWVWVCGLALTVCVLACRAFVRQPVEYQTFLFIVPGLFRWAGLLVSLMIGDMLVRIVFGTSTFSGVPYLLAVVMAAALVFWIIRLISQFVLVGPRRNA